MQNESTLCACGCGAPVNEGRRYLQYHHHRVRPALRPGRVLCACGCGNVARPRERYAGGHGPGKQVYALAKMPLIEQIAARSHRVGECVEWDGPVGLNGYARI